MRAGGSGSEQDRWIEGVFGGVGSGSACLPLETMLTGVLLALSVQALTNTGGDSGFCVSGPQMSKHQNTHKHQQTNKENMVNAKKEYL